MRQRRQPEIIAGQVSTVPAFTAGGDGCSLFSGGTGITQITFPAGFRMITVVASPLNPSAAMLTVDQITGSTVVVRTYTAAGAAAGVPFTFSAVGVQQ